MNYFDNRSTLSHAIFKAENSAIKVGIPIRKVHDGKILEHQSPTSLQSFLFLILLNFKVIIHPLRQSRLSLSILFWEAKGLFQIELF